MAHANRIAIDFITTYAYHYALLKTTQMCVIFKYALQTWTFPAYFFLQFIIN